MGLEDRLYLSSFHHFMWRHVQSAAKARGLGNLPFGYLTEFVQSVNLPQLVENFTDGDSLIVDVNNLVFDYDMVKDDLSLFLQRGIDIGVYFPIDDPMETQTYLTKLKDEYSIKFAIVNKIELAEKF
jgi:hypothetical protein